MADLTTTKTNEVQAMLKQLDKTGIRFEFATKNSGKVTNLPFWAKAEDTEDPFVKVHMVQQNETPADFIIRTCGRGTVVMDCNLFNQFVCRLPNWKDGPMFFAIPASGVAKNN